MPLNNEACDRGRKEIIDLAMISFGRLQSLREKWLEANNVAKRQILNTRCRNCTHDGVILVPTIRKPFDVFAERLVFNESRGDRI